VTDGGGDRFEVTLPRALRDQTAVVIAPDVHAVATTAERAGPATALAAALDAGQVRVAYQPIVVLGEERAVAVEALLRPPVGLHPGLPDPATAIAVAEADGLIEAVGAYVLGHASAEVLRLRRRPGYGELQVHVNVSPLQLRDARFVPLVEGVLEATSLPPEALVLEITESAAFEHDGVAEATLGRLTSLGVEVSIDDFGTGFASLELLAATPARSIKLDRSFVSAVGDVGETARGRALVVQAAIGLGRSLGLRIVAEGIESREQARTLEAWGCEFGQGYLFGHPSDPPQLPTLTAPIRRPSGPSVRALRSDAVDLALATAVVVLRSERTDAVRRGAAQELASVIADACGLDRNQADLAVVLAAIVDATRLPDPDQGDRTAVELRRALDQPAAVGRTASAAAIARAAWELAGQRAEGAAASAALRAVLGPTAHVDHELATRVGTWWATPPPEVLPLDLLHGPERRLRDRDQAGRRLRSLTSLAQAIGTPGSLEDILEITAEEARVALGAASLSISRFERDRAQVRTLINVGDLAPWEQRRPRDEVYPLAEYGVASRLLLDGAVHIEAIGTPTTDGRERELLEHLGKGSSAVVPIVIDGDVWGEVFATTAVDEPPFTSADIPFLGAIANVVSLAVRRIEQVDELARLASEDALTRLPNRRSLQRWLEQAVADTPTGGDVTLLLLDVQGLGEINDAYGHGEGDRVLIRVADTLTRATLRSPDAFAARVAGDEFCIGLRGGLDTAVELFGEVRDRLAGGPPPQPRLVGGIATHSAGGLHPVQLLQRADAAQYRARQAGAALLALGPDGAVDHVGDVPDDVAVTEARPASLVGGAVVSSLERWTTHLDAGAVSGRLEAMGEVVLAVLDLNRWVVSEAPTGSGRLHVRSIHARRRRPNPTPFTQLDEEVYELDEFPLTAEALRTGAGFVIDVDDPRADPHERALLEEFGHRYVVVVPATTPDGDGWLLELYGDERSAPVDAAIALIEAVATRTLGRELRCR
jgi:diguanylate cyclase (GGDEF)-like protein